MRVVNIKIKQILVSLQFIYKQAVSYNCMIYLTLDNKGLVCCHQCFWLFPTGYGMI